MPNCLLAPVRARPAALIVALALACAALIWLPQPAHAGPDAPTQLFLPAISRNHGAVTASSFSLIDQAVARGEIDAETGVIYTMYALFDDPRLPAQYRGSNSNAREASSQSRIARDWHTYKQSTRDALLPFVIPPIYAGSWFELRYGRGASVTDDTICGAIMPEWNSVKTNDGKVRVWWNNKWPADKAQAEGLAINLDARIWAALVEIHGAGHTPLNDAGVACGGPDAALDIFLTPITASGYFMPFPEFLGPSVGCPSRAGQLQMERTQSDNDADATLIHELMHAFNASYNLGHSCYEYDWLDEATAEWAVDYADPKNNDEHYFFRYFLDTPYDPLEADMPVLLTGETDAVRRPYGASIFPYFLNRYRGGPRQIGRIWEAGLTKNSLDAINSVVTGELKQAWPDFALKTWNSPPVDDYRKDDNMPQGPKTHYPADQSRIEMGGKLQWQKAVPSSALQHLATRYFHFTFNDPMVRSVGWYNGITARLKAEPFFQGPGGPFYGQTYFSSTASEAEKKGAHVWAIYKIAGRSTWEQPENWSGRAFTGFCRDVSSERITDLVLIYSNSEWQDRTYELDAPGEEPQLYMSNVGCWQWEGKSIYKTTIAGTMHTTVEVDVTWERHSFGPHYPLPIFFRLAKATGKWTVSGTMGECSVSGSGPFIVDPADEPQLTIYDRILSGPGVRAYSGRGQTNQQISYTVTCPTRTYTATESIGVWWEPPTGSEPEVAFKSVKDDGITIEDTETRSDAFDTIRITETRSLKARPQP